MTRRLVAGVLGVALAAGSGSLLLANGISGGDAARSARVALYVVFLVAMLTLLAGAIAYSEKSIDQLAAARATLPRRRVRTAVKRAGHRAGLATRKGVRFAARASRAGARELSELGAQLESALTPERRHALLRALGLEDIEANPNPRPGRYAAAHARRPVATSAITRRYNAFEARRGARSRVTRVASR
jgi:hypothetical protein